MPRIKKYIYDKFVTGTWKVKVGGVDHFVQIDPGPVKFIKVYLDSESKRQLYYIKLSSSSQAFARTPKDYAKTILFHLDPQNNKTALVPGQVSGVLHTLAYMENYMERPFSPKLFSTLFKVILEKNLANSNVVFKKDLDGLYIYDHVDTGKDHSIVKKKLYIGKYETDKNILGRLLCGVYLSEGKDNQPIFPLDER